MKIYFYKNASFKPTDVAIYDCNGVVEFFDKNHINPDEYVISDKCGNEHEYDYDLHNDIYIIFPKIAKGSSGKGWLGVVLGIVTIFTAGATAGLLGLTLNGARMLGVGMLLSGAGTLIMGQQKLPSMDINSDSATKQNYQWNVGNLSTNRGVKGVTFGSDVVPEGELLAYRTYGTSSISGAVSETKYYYGKHQEVTKAQYEQGRKSSIFFRVETTHTDAYANDDGTSWLEMLIGCGEGELDSITDIKVNDTPIENIEDANYEIRLGTNVQPAFSQTDLDSQVGIMSVGQTMPQKLSGSDNPLVITTSHACDSALIALQTNVLYNMDTQSGAKNRCYLKPKIGYRLSGSSDAYTYVKTGIGEIDNDLPLKAESAFYFNVAIKFPSNGIYEISLQNCSAEKCVEKGLLGSLPTVLPDRLQCAISIDNIALYDNVEQTFPGTALIYLRLPASQALSGSMPKVTWKQSRNNTYVWNGSSYVAKPLDNLAWAIYDILAQVRRDSTSTIQIATALNPSSGTGGGLTGLLGKIGFSYTLNVTHGDYHNEGEDVANIDYDKFADFADFCDDLGLKGNWFLNKLDTAWSTAMSVATSARAFIGTRNGRIAPFWDCATEMTQIFTVGNYESLSGAVNAKKDRARAIEATFNDEDDNYISKTIRVEVDDFAADADAVGVTYVGLTNVDAVYKAAHYQLRKNKYLCQTVKFTANLDALVCELNDVIGVQCDITKYGVGGRIFAVNGNSISLDAPVTLNGGNYALLVAHDNGTVERMQVNEHTGTLTTVTISGYTRAPKANEVYSFGVVNNEVKKYRVTSIVKTSDLKCEIEAVEYQPQVYVEGVAPDISYTNPNANISNIAVTYNPEGVDIAWHKDVNTAYVDVYVDGVYYGRFAEGATIPNVNSTQQIECVPVNAYGEEGTSVVRAISNSIPAPSQPPVPIVQALPTGAVVQFQIPQNQYITWIIIKEGDDELGRSIVAGDEVTLNLNLEGGTHHLTAYFLNSYGKTSSGRNFDATPFGIDSNMLSNGFLMKPQGSILRLSAKGCDSTSIKSANGVKDVSGYNHHGQAYGGVSVLDGGEGFITTSVSASNYIQIANMLNNIGTGDFTIMIEGYCNTGNTATWLSTSIPFEYSTAKAGFWIATASNPAQVYVGLHGANASEHAEINTGVSNNTTVVHQIVMKRESGKLYAYVDGLKLGSEADCNWSISTNDAIKLFVAYNGSSYPMKGCIKQLRIYNRALSDTEVKSMYMLPDEAIFGQLNADLIGANVIRASNLVMTEALITNAAQIDQAVVNNLNVSGNATFQAGLASKNNYVYITSPYSATLSTINDYSTRSSLLFTVGATEAAKVNVGDTVALKYAVTDVPSISYVYITGKCLTKTSTTVTLECQGYINPNSMSQTINAANAVKTGVGTLGYTSIHGGNIATETIEAGSIKAGAITAQKLNVEAIKKPRGEYLMLSMRGMNAPNTTDGICDISGNKRHLTGSNIAGFGVGTSDTGSYITFNGTSSYAKRTGISSIGNSYTFHMKVYLNSVPSFSYLCCVSAFSGTTETRQFGLWLNGSRQLKANVNGVDADLDCGVTLALSTIYTITATYNGSSLVVWVNGVKKATVSRTAAQKTGNILMIGARANGSGGGSYLYPVGMYLYDFAIYPRVISDNEIVTLYMLGIDPEAGQITADRIATDAIKSRNYQAPASGSIYAQLGTFLDLANGDLIAKGFRLNSSGANIASGLLNGIDITKIITVVEQSMTISKLAGGGTDFGVTKGYIKFSNNTIMIFGGIRGLANGTEKTITLPITMLSRYYNVFVTPTDDTSLSDHTNGYISVRSRTTTSFSIYVSGTVSNAAFFIVGWYHND